jgi:hypothetical protein
MRKIILTLFSVLALSTSAQALDVLVVNESDHGVKIYSHHTWHTSLFAEEKKWYYVAPHQSIKIFTNDSESTQVFMYRTNLKAALSNTLYLGGVYTGSTALSMTNALAWFPAAAVVAKTTWNGLPFTMQTIDPNTPIEAGLVKAILIENYTENKDTIQSNQATADLKIFTPTMLSNIGLMVNNNREFEERYGVLADLIGSDTSDWDKYDFARQLEEDLKNTIDAKIKAAQKKSVAQTIKDLQPIISQFPDLAKDYAALKQLTGIQFYIESVKFAQKVNDLRMGKVADKAPDSSEDEIGNVESSASSDEDQMPEIEEVD